MRSNRTHIMLKKMPVAVLALAMVLLSACKEENSVLPPSSLSGVLIEFVNGFHGDSVVVVSDLHIIYQGRFFSDSLNMVGGVNFLAASGGHFLRLELPEDDIRSDTTYVARDGYATRIEVRLDRVRKSLSYEFFFLRHDSSGWSAPTNLEIANVVHLRLESQGIPIIGIR